MDQGGPHLWTIGVAVELSYLSDRQLRVTAHSTITANDGDSPSGRLTQTIGNGIDFRYRVLLRGRLEYRSDGPTMVQKLVQDTPLEPSTKLGLEHQAGRQGHQTNQDQRDTEDLGPNPECHGSSSAGRSRKRYPTPRRVST